MLKMIDNAASLAEGSLKADIWEQSSQPKKGGLLSYISFGYYGQTDENDPLIDNRSSYLVFKGSTLRSLGKKQEAKELLEEVISHKQHLVDKLYYVIALTEMGKCFHKEDTEKALQYFKEAIKITGYTWDDAVRLRLRTFMAQLGMEDKAIEEQYQSGVVDTDPLLDGEEEEEEEGDH